jgi:hypothetical protein
MANKYDKILGEYREDDGVFIKATVPTVKNGRLWLNTSDDTLYIYYGTWQVVAILTPLVLSIFLLEDGDNLLQETGDKLALEA